MKWNTIDGPIDQCPDPLDSMSKNELNDLLDEIREPHIEEWPDGTLVLETPPDLEDLFDLEHQVIKKLREKEFEPEADIIADKISENLRDDLRKTRQEREIISPRVQGPK